MFTTYFGEWGTGRLKRLPYFGYHVLLMVLLFAIMIAFAYSIGIAENMIGGDLAAAQATLLSHFGILTMIGVAIVSLGVLFAQINLLAKRIRDMGLPPVWTIAGIFITSAVLSLLFPAQPVEVSTAIAHASTIDGNTTAAAISQSTTMTPSAVSQLFSTVIFLCLLFIPTDAFKKHIV